MRITKSAFVEHRSLSTFDLSAQWSYGGVRAMAPGACSCTSCCSCTAAISLASRPDPSSRQ